MLDFMLEFGAVGLALANALGTKFIEGSRASAGPVGRALEQALALNNEGELDARDEQLARLNLLARQLNIISRHRPELIAAFRKRLLTGSDNEFPGVRFEVTTATWLILRSVPFEKGESPDFEVSIPEGNVGIECTTARLESQPNKPLSYKLTSAIRTKAAKAFANPSTVVFLEMTNVLHYMASATVHTNLDDAISDVRDSVGTTALGAVVLFA